MVLEIDYLNKSWVRLKPRILDYNSRISEITVFTPSSKFDKVVRHVDFQYLRCWELPNVWLIKPTKLVSYPSHSLSPIYLQISPPGNSWTCRHLCIFLLTFRSHNLSAFVEFCRNYCDYHLILVCNFVRFYHISFVSTSTFCLYRRIERV